MKIEISQKEIGKRLAQLRKLKGLSQEDLSAKLEMSRSSLTQLELGNRGLDIFELQKLALILEFSLDNLMSNNFVTSQEIVTKKVKKKKETERISTPILLVNKLKNVLLYILEHCAGKPNVGERFIYKLLYFSDFNYYEIYEDHLTGTSYKKLPYGPFPEGLNKILEKMIEDCQLQKIKSKFNGHTLIRYLPMEKADLVELKASEKEVLDRVIEQMSDWSENALSNYSHKDMPWLASKDGEIINYELVFYREAPFSVRNYVDENE